MKKTLLLICSLLTLSCWGQAPDFAWVRKSNTIPYPDVSVVLNTHSTVVDTTNHFVYCYSSFNNGIDFGSGQLPANNTNLYLVKYTLDGSLVWAKSFLTDAPNTPTSMAIDGNGNLIISGYTQDDTLKMGNHILVNQNPGAQLVYLSYIAKLDPDGNAIWLKGSGDQGSGIHVEAITTDHSGNIYATGTADDPNGTFFGNTVAIGFFVMKLTPSGVVQWFYQSSTPNLSVGFSITSDSDGNCILAGSHENEFTLGAFMIPFNNGSSSWDRFVTKIDPSGTFLWALASGLWQGPEKPYHVSTDAQNNIFISGLETHAPDPMYNAYHTTDFLEKCDPDGNVLWHKTYVTSGSDALMPTLITDHLTTSAGDTYALLTLNDSTNFEGTIISSSSLSPTTNMNSSLIAVVIKYNAAGTIQWIKNTTDNLAMSYSDALAFSIDQGENLYLTGMLVGSINFDHMTIAPDNQEFFLAKLGNQPLGVPEIQPAAFGIYPNPAKDHITLQLDKNQVPEQVRMITTTGVELYRGNSNTIDVSKFPKGMYLIQVSSNGATLQSKLLID